MWYYSRNYFMATSEDSLFVSLNLSIQNVQKKGESLSSLVGLFLARIMAIASRQGRMVAAILL